jgi:hypothetical protein
MTMLLLALSAFAAEPVTTLYALPGPDVDYELVSVHDGSAVLWKEGRAYAVDLASGAMTEPGPVAKDDFVRWGLLVGPGPWWDRDYQPKVQPVTGTSTYAARKGEALVLVDENGAEQAQIVEGWNLDQKERIGPDGKKVAWVRYLGASGRYSVLSAPLVGSDYTNMHVADGPGYPMAGPIWSHDGVSLYLTSIESKTACLIRADAEPIMEIWQLQCVGGMQGASLVVAPSGTMAAFVLHKTPTHADVLWVDLPGGIVKNTVKVTMQGTRTSDLLVDDEGLFIARGAKGKGLVVVDLKAGTTATYDDSAAFEGLPVTSWIAPGKTVLVRKTGNSADVVTVDARAALASGK